LIVGSIRLHSPTTITDVKMAGPPPPLREKK
jgi:hypothetical protein